MAEINEIPIIKNYDELNEYDVECDNQQIPCLYINGIGRRTWYAVECEMMTTSFHFEPNNPADAGGYAILDEDAVAEVNELCKEYKDVNTRDNGSALSTAYGAAFLRFPDMREKTAKQFASELSIIVMNEKNWIPNNERL